MSGDAAVILGILLLLWLGGVFVFVGVFEGVCVLVIVGEGVEVFEGVMVGVFEGV